MRPSVVLSMVIVAGGFFLEGCATVRVPRQAAAMPPSQAPLTIEQAGVEPKILDLARDTKAAFRYALTQPATVSFEFLDEEGRRIRQISLGPREGGVQTAHWDAKDDHGRDVPNGVYRYVIRAQDREGKERVYDPAQEMGGEELEPRNFTWDPDAGLFRWVMPKAGYARLRMGIEGFPHLRTLLDWEPLEAGEKRLPWDGPDSSGLIRLKEHPKLQIKLAAFALAPNTVIVRGSRNSSAEIPESQGATHSSSVGNPSYLHAGHSRNLCREVRLRIEFPGASQDTQGRPQLAKGRVPIRVSLDPRDATRVINERFEVALFEDLTVIFEEEEGLTPFTFMWDTAHLTPGQHLLTVNILGLEDHYGVETRAVVIEGISP